MYSMFLGIFFVLTMFCCMPVYGNDGAWIGGDGYWSDSTKWQDGIIADGTNNTANFDLEESDRIYLDTNRTVGHLSFCGKYGGRFERDGWVRLTLETTDGTVPTITTNSEIYDTSIWFLLGGNQGFDKLGGKTLLLHESANYTGVVNIREGLIQVWHNSALGASGTGNETIVFGGTNLMIGPDHNVAEKIILTGDGTEYEKGALTLHNNSTLTGSIILDGNASIRMRECWEVIGTSRIKGSIYLPDCAILTLDCADGGFELYDIISESGSLNIKGPGKVTLFEANSYQGGTTVNDAILQINISYSLGSTSGPLTLNSSELIISGTNSPTIGHSVVLNSVINEIEVEDSENTATISGNISGDAMLKKTGPGTLILSGNNSSYTGAVLVETGTLKVGINDSLRNDTHAGIQEEGLLEIQDDVNLGSVAGTGAIELNEHCLKVGFNGLSQGLGGPISGTGALIKEGSGTLTLVGDNTYTGGTTVNEGVLELEGYNESMTGTILVNDGAILRAGVDDSLSSDAVVNIATGGIFELQGDESFGSLTGNGSVVTNGYNLGAGIDDTNTTFSGVISGSGELHKLGDGILTLSGDNTYTAGTHIEAGTLNLTPYKTLLGAITIYDGATFYAPGTTRFGQSVGETTICQVNEGGLLQCDRYFVIGYDGTATLNQIGGNVFVDDNMPLFIAERLGSSGTYNLDGGSLHVTGGLCIGGNFGNYGGTAVMNISDSSNMTVDGLTKIGYGGTIAGTGSVIANINNLGIVAPGSSTGILTIDGNYVQEPNGILKIELGGVEPNQCDALIVTGNINLAGTLEVKLIDGFIPLYGDTFDILDWDRHSGTFDTLDIPSPPDAQYWDTSNLYTTGQITFVGPCLNWDLNCDGCTNLSDYSKLSSYWMESPCTEDNWFCNGTDLDKSGIVDFNDIEILVTHWLHGCE
jgi:autotransporter-associated beta strand protein